MLCDAVVYPTVLGGSGEVLDSGQVGEIPTGQELDVRLGTTLSSKTTKVEQRFEATTVADVTQNATAQCCSL